MKTFIVGTDTDVGKTFYGKKKIKDNLVIKPIETGKNSFINIKDSDSYKYAMLQNKKIDEINLYFFNEPVSPHYASDIDKINIDIAKVKTFINKYDNVTVELAGGLLVPLTNNYTQLDLLKDFDNCEVELVIGNKLGCINHSLMTIKILEDNNIIINKLVFNNLGKKIDNKLQNNINTIMSFTNNKYKFIVI